MAVKTVSVPTLRADLGSRGAGRRKAAMGGSPARRLWRLAAVLAMAAGAALPRPAAAQQGTVSIVRDAETEALLQEYAAPLFKAAGIRTGSVEILLIPSREFNAFVADGRSIFINTGALLDSRSPNEIIGVLAHEIGHLAGGHLGRMRDMIRQTQIASMIAGLIGMGAVVAGGAAGVEGLGEAGGGVMAGIGEIGNRNILSYARTQETSADRAAITYLEATGQSGQGMLDVFARLADQSLFASRDVDPYLQSHPLPRERIALLSELVASSRFAARRDPPALQARHDLMRAKLAGFTETPQQVGRRYPRSDDSLPARYARAIAAYRSAGLDRALPLIDDLIAADGDNPFFLELKGQALLERGRAGDAVAPLRQAVKLEPGSGLLRIMLGHAMVESGRSALLDEAIKNLTIGLNAAPNVAVGYRILGRAYAERGDLGLAQLATAQGLFADGAIDEARVQAARAQGKLTRGSPAWLRADDIVSYKPPDSRELR